MNNEKALEALKITHGLANTNLVWLENLAGIGCPELHQYIRQQESTPPFDEAIKIVEDKIAFINAETFEDYDRIKHYGELLSALKARLPK